MPTACGFESHRAHQLLEVIPMCNLNQDLFISYRNNPGAFCRELFNVRLGVFQRILLALIWRYYDLHNR